MARATQHTASAAVLGTGAELSRRGYDVTFTLGNTRRVDMLCSVPDGRPFKVQVKGTSNQNAFYIDKAFFDGEVQTDLFLVVVLVPKEGDDSSPRFFVLSRADAKKEFDKLPKVRRDGRPFKTGGGLNWGSITPYERAWSKFPAIDGAGI